MDSTACHVIYVNRSVAHNRFIPARRDGQSSDDSDDEHPDHVRRDIKPLLDAFGDGKPEPVPDAHARVSCQSMRFC